jgi:anti-sigma-K factor RskA
MTHEQAQDLLPAYALGALSNGEAHAVEDFLAKNPANQKELYAWQDVVASLAYAVAPQDPPNDLRRRLFEKIRLEENIPAPVSNVVPMPSRAVPRAVAPPVEAAPPAKYRWLAVAAAVAACILLGALFLVWRKNQSLQQESRALADQLAQERLLHEHLLGPDGRGAFLQGTQIAPKAHAHLTYNVKNRQALLAIRELPPAPAGKNYQIWFITNGQPIPGPTFNTGPAGVAEITLQAPENGLMADSFAVTLEPQYGVNSPTGEKYLVTRA